MEMIYNGGKGKCRIDLTRFSFDSKIVGRLRDMVMLAGDKMDGYAGEIYAECKSRLEKLTEQREAQKFIENKAKYTTEIKKIIKAGNMFAEICGAEALEDAEAEIKLTAATVYVRMMIDGKPGIKEFAGWTFSKSGITFDMYRVKYQKCSEYVILLGGTGTQCGVAYKSKQASIAALEIDRIKAVPAERLQYLKSDYTKLMKEAGYLPAENKEEEETMKTAKTEKPAAEKPAAEKPAPIKAAEPEKPAEVKPAQPEPVREPEKPDEKPLTGKGWQIVFDKAMERTRVIFESKPRLEVRAAVKEAGFWWNGTTKSWNRGLSKGARKAALELAGVLGGLCA